MEKLKELEKELNNIKKLLQKNPKINFEDENMENANNNDNIDLREEDNFPTINSGKRSNIKSNKERVSKSKSVDKISNKRQRKIKQNNKDDSNINENEYSCNIFSYKDRNNNTILYVYHYTYKDTIYLRFKDRLCKGTARSNNGIIYPLISCNLKYEDHSYLRFKITCDKINENNNNEDDMKEKIFQQSYFENIHTNFPKLTYDDICLNLYE